MPRPTAKTRPTASCRGVHTIRTLVRKHKLLAIMTAHWFQRFAGRFNFPDNYTCIDIETNGTDPENNQICTIGYTVVRDSKPVFTEEDYLNWPDFEDIDQAMFKYNLDCAEAALRRQGKPFHHTYETLRAKGNDPRVVLRKYLALCEEMEERNEVLVAHNGWRFDIEFLQAHFHNWLHVPFVFMDGLVYDTGISEKASQLDEFDDPLPRADETLRQFAWRIGDLRRRGIYWALDRHCDEQYGLFEKAGVDRGLAHSAAADSLLLAALMEEHKRLAKVRPAINDVSDAPQQVVE